MYMSLTVPRPAHRGKSTLNPTGIYGSISAAQNCLSLTWNAVTAHLNGNSAPNCLRMAFHDAGTYSTVTDTGG